MRRRPTPTLRMRPARVRVGVRPWLFAAALLVAAAMASGIGGAASSTTIVSADVPSATTLTTTGCPALDPTKTSFGVLQPGSAAITGADCDVLFGSSNDTATLRAYQPDGRAGAMTSPTLAMTTAGSSGRILGVDMATNLVGWAVGEGTTSTRLLKTTNGGVSWTGVSDANDGLNGAGEGIDAVSTTVAWGNRYDSNEITTTSDAESGAGNGGTVWVTKTMSAFPAAEVNKVIAYNDQIAWAGGAELISGLKYARIWKTTDGGDSWTLVWSDPLNNSNRQVLGGVVIDATHVYFATTTSGGGVLGTSNGTTFSVVPNAPTTDFQDVDGYDANHLTAVSDGGYVYQTANGGTTWTLRDTPVDLPHYSVDYESSGTIVVGSESGFVQRSTDHGATWTVLDEDADHSRVYSLDSVGSTIVAGMHGMTVGASVDTGATWSRWASSTAINWADVDAADGGRLWRVGSGGRIETSTDGGSSWTLQTSGTTRLLNEVEAISRTTAVAVGVDGTIVRTTDGGTTWATVTSGTNQTLLDVTAVFDGRTMYASGLAGTLLRSTDAGGSWTTLGSGLTVPISSVAAWDSQRVLIGASGGSNTQLMRRSLDGGQTWTTLTTPATDGVLTMLTVPGTTSNRAYAVEDINLLTTTDGGATWSTTGLGGNAVMDLDGTDDGVNLWLSGEGARVNASTNSGATWSTYTGGSNNRTMHGIAALGPDDAVAVGEGSHTKVTAPSVIVSDYDGAAASWTGTGFFGMCLRAAPSTGSTWPTDGTCDQANGTEWRGIPLSGASVNAPVASTLAPGTTTASFRFGMKAPSSLAPGTYRAAITFEVTAPAG